ncbi:MAG: hypothetical protein COS14_14325 [Bacteroidetes bacterium CG02_land_8_20_14_3_00_31_25]|nr:hypothetical protein [Bacteroidota bacterium]PIV57539.1 MAG: hypothetical protein COS14_14325 [Bacteroidetes bacterium CG02_land_8_20_14_3_00_31_25]PIX32437.1 MAG: hypothetical protein COZ59_13985 [Bacteroidetes bacterium CG_4_8_14_3_um_filter_31_14]PIY04674.1 MAG: hypothetical protein COZ21_06010 [Bacteroidetes bacterium CG_4_10_14_3_um_filter_31_20]
MLKKLSFIIVLTFCFGFIFLSCHKTTPPKAIVTVVDTGEIRLANVKVTVYAKPNGSYIDPESKIVNDIQYTDAGGDAYFTFKNKAILTAKAELFIGNSTIPSKSGEKLLKLDEDHTETKTIEIK